MKTTISNKSPAPFPKLQKATNGNIFLMRTPQSGTCVYDASNNIYFLGHYYKDLPSENLSDFNDILILEN